MNDSVQLLGGPYAYNEPDLVVASQHADLVKAQLEAAGVEFEEAAESEVLDLTLLRLDDVKDDAAPKMVAKVKRDVPQAGQPPSPAPLDQVLWALRELNGAKYAGWTPTIGKNRFVGQVHGVGEVNHGGGGDPVKLDVEPSPSSRAAGPGRGVRVGVLDTGLYPQPWLAGGWVARHSDLLADGDRALYSDGHATFVTGLILGRAPGATVEVRRVLNSTGVAETNGSADSWSVAEAIVRFARSGLHILNLSFSCYTEDGQPPIVLSAAMDRLPPDLVVVAAAGNHGEIVDPVPDPESQGKGVTGQGVKPSWPAALDDVLAVGGLAADQEQSASFSPDAPWVDVLAPSEDLTSTYIPSAKKDENTRKAEDFPGGWAQWRGTSFAAALVSGTIAASTDPGRVSARAAMIDLLGSLPDSKKLLKWPGAKVFRVPQVMKAPQA